MAAMSNDALSKSLGQFLTEEKARDVVVLNVHESCSWASLFVIATYNSQGHLKGLVESLDQWSSENRPDVPRRMKKSQVNEWTLVDWDDVIIHLFSESARSYYELERLWFNAPVLYRQPQ